MTLDPDEVNDPFTITNTFELDLEKIEKTAWAYPLPGAKVISPYGGKRRHSGLTSRRARMMRLWQPLTVRLLHQDPSMATETASVSSMLMVSRRSTVIRVGTR